MPRVCFDFSSCSVQSAILLHIFSRFVIDSVLQINNADIFLALSTVSELKMVSESLRQWFQETSSPALSTR